MRWARQPDVNEVVKCLAQPGRPDANLAMHNEEGDPWGLPGGCEQRAGLPAAARRPDVAEEAVEVPWGEADRNRLDDGAEVGVWVPFGWAIERGYALALKP